MFPGTLPPPAAPPTPVTRDDRPRLAPLGPGDYAYSFLDAQWKSILPRLEDSVAPDSEMDHLATCIERIIQNPPPTVAQEYPHFLPTVAAYFRDLKSLHEIAQELGLTPNAVKPYVAQTLKRALALQAGAAEATPSTEFGEIPELRRQKIAASIRPTISAIRLWLADPSASCPKPIEYDVVKSGALPLDASIGLIKWLNLPVIRMAGGKSQSLAAEENADQLLDRYPQGTLSFLTTPEGCRAVALLGPDGQELDRYILSDSALKRLSAPDKVSIRGTLGHLTAYLSGHGPFSITQAQDYLPLLGTVNSTGEADDALSTASLVTARKPGCVEVLAYWAQPKTTQARLYLPVSFKGTRVFVPCDLSLLRANQVLPTVTICEWRPGTDAALHRPILGTDLERNAGGHLIFGHSRYLGDHASTLHPGAKRAAGIHCRQWLQGQREDLPPEEWVAVSRRKWTPPATGDRVAPAAEVEVGVAFVAGVQVLFSPPFPEKVFRRNLLGEDDGRRYLGFFGTSSDEPDKVRPLRLVTMNCTKPVLLSVKAAKQLSLKRCDPVALSPQPQHPSDNASEELTEDLS